MERYGEKLKLQYSKLRAVAVNDKIQPIKPIAKNLKIGNGDESAIPGAISDATDVYEDFGGKIKIIPVLGDVISIGVALKQSSEGEYLESAATAGGILFNKAYILNAVYGASQTDYALSGSYLILKADAAFWLNEYHKSGDWDDFKTACKFDKASREALNTLREK